MKRKLALCLCVAILSAYITACGSSATEEITSEKLGAEESTEEISSVVSENESSEPVSEATSSEESSSKNEETSSEEKLSETEEISSKENIESLESELTNKINDNSDSNSSGSASSEELEFEAVNYGDKISLDFVEMSIDTASISEEIYPTDTSGVYSYKPDQDGEQYFYLSGTIKNTGGSAYSVEDMEIEFVFDDKYTYSGYLIADDGGNDFFGDYVKPFGSVKYYIYSSIPDELISTYSICNIKFAFNDNFDGGYSIEFENSDYLYQITISR